ncbi:MAG TPA: ABC-F family ATP-binding cassette domain-containing protein [Polyangiaceae bacterium]|nr:ABC-F family ATP-binding cassette domain-containing protein [Polyangiaceae bacterium]
MSLISVRGLSKSYGSRALFAQVALTVSAGERVGLIGANGAGKSSFLRVLAGLEAPDEGTIELGRGARVAYLAQEPVLDPEATPRQLVERAMADWHAAVARYQTLSEQLAENPTPLLVEQQAELAETIERLGGFRREHLAERRLLDLGVLELDRPVASMSGGERRRIALAQLLVSEPDLAILDEPTNHLDTGTIEWLERHLADEFRGAVLMVTHDRYVLDAVVDRVVELEAGRLQEYTGAYAEYLEQKAERLAHAERVEQNRLNLLRREQAWLRRGAKARTTKQKARIKRAQGVMSEAPAKQAAAIDFGGLERGAARLGKTVLELDGVGLEIGGRTLIDALDLRLVAGDRVGVVGPNGAGKTSLLRLVSSDAEPTRGSVRLGQNTVIAYFDQLRDTLRPDWTVLENVVGRQGSEQNAGVVQIGEQTLTVRAYLELFLFDGSEQRRPVSSLSGGERARVSLAKALKTGANLLLLDEPTNDLDLITLTALEDLLEGWPGCLIVVSHDRYFLNRVATSILAFEGDGKVVRHPGDYDRYRSLAEQARVERAAAARTEARAAAAPAAPKVAGADAPRQRPLSYAEKKELDTIMDTISEIEEQIAAREMLLAKPDFYTGDPAEVKRVVAELPELQAELAAKTARWEELEARRDLKAK